MLTLARGLRARAQLSDYAYGVEKQAIRHDMLVSFSRSAVLLLIAIIILTVYGVLPKDDENEFLETESPIATAVQTPEIDQTAESIPQTQIQTETIAPVNTESPTDEPTIVVEPTETLSPTVQSTTAAVESFNGLWLRSGPDADSQELELIPDGTVLILLDGLEPVGQAEWQQVRAPSGQEGWVFIQFILYQ